MSNDGLQHSEASLVESKVSRNEHLPNGFSPVMAQTTLIQGRGSVVIVSSIHFGYSSNISPTSWRFRSARALGGSRLHPVALCRRLLDRAQVRARHGGDRSGHHPADAGGGRAAHRGGDDRRAGEVRGAVGPGPRRHRPPPARARRGAADVAHDRRGHGPRLRPDLRGGEAPPAQAREVPRPARARVHQPRGVRGMRGLRREVELRGGGPGGDRIRKKARHRPVVVQQGL